ncbi:MAG: non-ribosomal peptide synthetase [Gammaproteobacteria bacterium]
MNLSSLVEARALAEPQSLALLAPGQPVITAADLWREVQALARALDAVGAAPGTPVATVLPNGLDAAISFLGVAAKAACVPLNPGLSADEIRFYLGDTRARIVIVDKALGGPASATARDLGLTVIEIDASKPRNGGPRDWLADVRPGQSGPAAAGLAAGDVALILHTSGTTSRPKLVPLTHANLLASARNIATGLGLESADRCLNVMPLFHIHGLVGVLLASLAGGSGVVCTRGFSDATFIDWVGEFQPTWYSAVPAIHQAVAALADRYRSRLPRHRFRFIRSSSAALSPATLRMLEAGTGAPVIEAYGMTEASHQMASNPLPPGLRKPGSVGVTAGAEVAIMDGQGSLLGVDQTGEVVIRGPGVMAAYGGEVGATRAAFTAGWFRTGDLGCLDADGYLFLSGRLKEIVNRGGEKVSPREVDEALLEHPEVGQAAAFGIPHPTLGEDLVAVVVPRPGVEPAVPELREFLFARLAGHKIPSTIAIVDEIPKGPTGKVQRSALYGRLQHLFTPAFVAPVTDIERGIDGIVRGILRCDTVGVHANFFALGGDSLTGVQVVAAINREQGIELPATALFHHPTIAELARAVEAARAAAGTSRTELAQEIDALSDEEVLRALAAEGDTPPERA